MGSNQAKKREAKGLMNGKNKTYRKTLNVWMPFTSKFSWGEQKRGIKWHE